MGPRRRPAARPVQETSESYFSDACDPQDEQRKAPSPELAGHSKGEKKKSKLIKRLVFGTLLLFMLCGIIAAGHLWTMFFVILIQWAMFRELVNVRYHQRRFKDMPLFRTSQWGGSMRAPPVGTVKRSQARDLTTGSLQAAARVPPPYVEFVSLFSTRSCSWARC